MKAGPQYQADFVLGTPLSIAVLEGRSIKLGRDVRKRPDIMLRGAALMRAVSFDQL